MASPGANTIVVNQAAGNDATATAGLGSVPTQTIGRAMQLANGLAGGAQVVVFPGTYAEAVVMPDNTRLQPMLDNSVTVSQSGATGPTDILTLGNNCSVWDLNLTATVTGHFQLRGAVFGTSTGSKIQQVSISLDNSAAGPGGTSNVYGVHNSGPGSTAMLGAMMRQCNVSVNGSGAGNKRAHLNDGAGLTTLIDSTLYATRGAGATPTGTYYALETTGVTGCSALVQTTLLSGDDADLSQSTGTIVLAPPILRNGGANHLGFLTTQHQPTFQFAGSGTLPTGTLHLKPGYGAATAFETQVPILQTCVLKDLYVHLNTGGSNSTVGAQVIVRVNGAATPLSTTILANMTLVSNTAVSARCNPGDLVSVRFANTDLAGAAEMTVAFSRI